MSPEAKNTDSKDRILAKQIAKGLQEKFPTSDKERQIAAELLQEGVYNGFFTKIEFERSIAQIAWVVMQKDGEQLTQRYRSLPIIGNLFSGSFLHNILESEISVLNSDEVHAVVRSHIHSPITGFVDFSYFLANQNGSVVCDMNRVKITKHAEGLNARALSRIKMGPMFTRHMSDIPALVEDTLQAPLRAEGIQRDVKVHGLKLNPQDTDKLLEVDLALSTRTGTLE